MRTKELVLAAVFVASMTGGAVAGKNPGSSATPGRALAPQSAQQAATPQRKPDIFYVPTPPEVVEAMLKLAGVTERDVVYDLGCGDGRIVATAAKEFGARGVGIDIDPQRVSEAKETVRNLGVADRVRIIEGDLFETPIGEASVVTLYLLPSLNVKLMPKLLGELKPGSRIVSHDFDMQGKWEPDKRIDLTDSYGVTHQVYFWIVPERK
jgi:predicted O-methyltransferase YrrM